METDMSAGNHKSQSQAEADDGGVIIQETEAYKVSPPELWLFSWYFESCTFAGYAAYMACSHEILWLEGSLPKDKGLLLIEATRLTWNKAQHVHCKMA